MAEGETLQQPLYDAIAFLTAETALGEQGRGWNRLDAEYGTFLSTVLRRFGRLSPGNFLVAQRVVKNYRRQLVKAGYDVDALKALPAPGPWRTERAPPKRATGEAAPSPVLPLLEALAKRYAGGLTVRATIIKATDKALLCEISEPRIQTWFPKRCVEVEQIDTRATKRGGHLSIVNLTMPAWLVRDKQLDHLAEPVQAQQ